MGKYVLPNNVKAFTKRRRTFEKFLVANGSEILEPTNPYEVMRFTTPEGTGIVYRDGNDKILTHHWMHGAQDAFLAYANGQKWRVGEKVRQGKSKSRHRRLGELFKRDGHECFYCLTELNEETATIEEVCPRTHGGPKHMGNLVLACNPCNEEAGHKSVKEKFDLAFRKRRTANRLKQLGSHIERTMKDEEEKGTLADNPVLIELRDRYRASGSIKDAQALVKELDKSK